MKMCRPLLLSPFLLSLALAPGGCATDDGTAMLPPPTEPPPATKKSGMTYYKDVQPILQRSCQGCHTAGGIAPFPLTTYDEARAFAAPMSGAVQARRMPPWMPAADCQHFQGARTLLQDEIDTIYSWAADGAQPGDERDAPPSMLPAVVALPWVDATLEPGADFTPAAKLTTDYHCSLLDPRLAQATDLIGYEVIPGARQQVHHVLLYPADAAEAQALDAKDAAPGWTCFGGPGTSRTGMIGAWVPGMPPINYPAGTGIQLQAGQVLVMQIHYDNHGGGAWAADRTKVRLQYARQPVSQRGQMLAVRDATFSVPPGAVNYAVETTIKAPSDMTLYGIAPHAHQAAQRIRVESPGACLIDIPRWDFSWQQLYFYDAPAGLPVKRGTQVKLTCVYNNTTTSPLRWGESTTDEMCLSYLYVTGT